MSTPEHERHEMIAIPIPVELTDCGIWVFRQTPVAGDLLLCRAPSGMDRWIVKAVTAEGLELGDTGVGDDYGFEILIPFSSVAVTLG